MPTFQKRHYEAIADTLAADRPPMPGKEVYKDRNTSYPYPILLEHRNIWFNTVVSFTVLFAEDNPNFDDARFTAACLDRPSTLSIPIPQVF